MHDFEEENISIGPLFMVVGVGTAFVIAVIFALTGLHSTIQQSRQAELGELRPVDVGVNHKEQTERLETYELLDAETGKVRIPIDEAMQLVLEERGEG